MVTSNAKEAARKVLKTFSGGPAKASDHFFIKLGTSGVKPRRDWVRLS